MTDPAPGSVEETGPPPWATALFVLGVGFLLFAAGNGRPGLLEQDEPRYAVTARTMARGGDWLVPQFNGRERLVKPPLTYWAIAASFRITGREDEGAARLPSAAAGALAALLVAFAAWRVWGRRWGVLGGLALASMPLHFGVARLATTDMLFTLFFTGAAAALLPALEGSPRSGRWILLSGLLAGLAALVKTPLAIVLPPAAAAGAAYLLARRPPHGPAQQAAPHPGLLAPGNRGRTLLALGGAFALFAAVFLAWFVAADRATEGRLEEELRRQVLMRTDPDSDTHPAPFWYYLAVLPAAALPWTLLLPAGVAACLRTVRRREPGAATAAFALALPAVVLAFFSALPSKLPAYVLPALPPLALVAAAGARSMVERPGSRAGALGRLAAGWGGLVLGAAAAAVPWVPALRDRVGDAALRDGLPIFAVSGGLLAAGGMLLIARRPRPGFAAFLAVTIALTLTAGPVLPRLEEEKCARGLVEAMRREGLGPQDRIYNAGNSLKGVPWYADRATETKPDGSSPTEAAVADALASRERVWAIAEHDPADKHAEGKRTQWDRILLRLPAGTPVPRVVFRGMGRIVVTNAPPR